MALADKLFLNKGPGKTFQNDENLPSLPIPPLRKTLEKYLESVRPFLNDAELRNTQKIVEKFEAHDGRDLQMRLLEKSKYKRNWLEKWWEDYAYLTFRLPGPLMNLSGPGPYIEHYWKPFAVTQTFSMAMTTHFTLKYWKMLRDEKLIPDMTSKKEPLSMSQYRRIFSSCKIPGVERDRLTFHFKTASEGPTPLHVVAMYKRRMFAFDVIDPITEEPFSAPEIKSQLDFIQQKCDGEPPGPGVGAMTSDERTQWAKCRNHLIELSAQNAKNLALIESCILLIVLDDAHGTDYTKLMTESLAGDCTNRWFDKTLSYITFRDGTLGSNCDHSPLDAMVLVSLTYFIDLNIMENKGQWSGSTALRPLSRPFEMTFDLDAKLHKAIHDATIKYKDKVVDKLGCYNPVFTGFGKKYLRSNKINPDAFLQMAIQYSYYKLYKRPAPTYETATTRQYYNARTETMRSCTMEALQWAKVMLNPLKTKTDKLQMLEIALQRHLQLMGEASNNHGCDRHLLGLYIVALEDGLPIPELFTDAAYTKSGGGGNFILSTSFVGGTTVGGGVSPMCPHGYGVFYRIPADKVVFFISTWLNDEDTSGRLIFRTICASLEEMKDLLESRSSNL